MLTSERRWPTDDEAAMLRLIEAAEAESAREVDAFEQLLSEVEAQLAQLGAER